MQNSIDIGWLDVGIREDSRLAVLDHNRLHHVISELSDPEGQYPSLCVFLGGKAKDYALQQLYPSNNIRRHMSDAQIKLRYNVASFETRQPILIVDGNIPRADESPTKRRLEAGIEFPVSWDCHSAAQMILVLWARLVFIFADVVCIFINDLSSLERTVDFLVNCLQFGTASPFPRKLLPRALFIFGASKESATPENELLYQSLRDRGCSDLSGLFSSTSSMDLRGDSLSDTAKYQQMKSFIAGQVNAISSIRQEYQARPNGIHLTALLRSALQHILSDPISPFNFVRATREDRPVRLRAQSNLTHYLEAGHRANLHLYELAPSISSALFMDHFVPKILGELQ